MLGSFWIFQPLFPSLLVLWKTKNLYDLDLLHPCVLSPFLLYGYLGHDFSLAYCQQLSTHSICRYISWECFHWAQPNWLFHSVDLASILTFLNGSFNLFGYSLGYLLCSIHLGSYSSEI